jgi:hypothetical protein
MPELKRCGYHTDDRRIRADAQIQRANFCQLLKHLITQIAAILVKNDQLGSQLPRVTRQTFGNLQSGAIGVLLLGVRHERRPDAHQQRIQFVVKGQPVFFDPAILVLLLRIRNDRRTFGRQRSTLLRFADLAELHHDALRHREKSLVLHRGLARWWWCRLAGEGQLGRK